MTPHTLHMHFDCVLFLQALFLTLSGELYIRCQNFGKASPEQIQTRAALAMGAYYHVYQVVLQ